MLPGVHAVHGRLHIMVLTFGSASKHARRCQAREFARRTRLGQCCYCHHPAVSLCLSRLSRLLIALCDHRATATSLKWLPKIIIEERTGLREDRRNEIGPTKLRKRVSFISSLVMIAFEMRPTPTPNTDIETVQSTSWERFRTMRPGDGKAAHFR